MSLAINIPAGQSAQYFYGDNIEGYHEGLTHRTGGGSGYWLEGQPLFRDFVTTAGTRTLKKEDASDAEIIPHTIRHLFSGATDELSILHKQRALAITIASGRAMKLGAAMLFDGGAGEQTIKPAGAGFTIRFAHHRFTAAVCASATVALTGPAQHDGLSGPAFATNTPRKELTFYIAFDRDARRALAKATSLARANGRAAHEAAIDDILQRSAIDTGQPGYDRAVAWAKLTSYFLVTEEFGKGIWAGLPWFKNNWGRDTFIALPGTLLVTGLFDDARDVILNFLRYQDRNPKSPTYGRVPNRVQSATDIIYNTADGTPWLIRELYEYLQYTGDLALAKKVYPQVKLALDGAIKKFVDREGFLTHDDADTWMDARIEGNLPWSARGNRANDIQALWHNALLVGERLAGYSGDAKSARAWRTLADKVKTNFTRRFWNEDKGVLADRITADNRRDEKVRPNQLMVLSIPMIEPLLDDARAAKVVKNAVSELLYPYGIASLSQNDRYFHPYHHNDAWHHFDAAYHNGTVWGWNAGFAVTALCQTGQTERAAKLAANLAGQILNLGCRGSMSELLEAIPRKGRMPQLSGTWAQAWSTSEFARNAYQDFGGFHPRLLDGEIHLRPHWPKDWKDVSAVFPFGRGARLLVESTNWDGERLISVRVEGHARPLDLCFAITQDGKCFEARLPISEQSPLLLRFTDGILIVNNEIEIPGTKAAKPRALRFAKPATGIQPPCLRKKHYLQGMIERGKFR